MKKLLNISLIFFIATTLGLLYILLFAGTEIVKMPNDSRITVNYAPDLHKLVLSEMRDYLEVMNEIQQGVATENPEMIYNAAIRQGLASFEDTPARLLKMSPLACKKMGFQGHKIFQEIADSAKTNYNAATTARQMAKLTNNCITCHRTYKLKSTNID